MAGSRFGRVGFSIISCMALCAIVVVRAADYAIERIVHWIDYALSLIPAAAPFVPSTGQLQPTPAFALVADPQVDRHEAGASRRAAARHI